MHRLTPSRPRFAAAFLLLILVGIGYRSSETAHAQTVVPRPVGAVPSESELGPVNWIAEILNQGPSNGSLTGGNTWYEYAHLTAPDAAEYDLFGSSVSVSGNTAVVGALVGDSTAAAESGAAYVFIRNGNVWALQQKLTPSDGATDDRFGSSVSVSGDTVIVGAFYDDTLLGADSGSAYVFTRNGTVWTEQQKLTPSEGVPGDLFGASVAISGEFAIIGAHFDDTPAGVDAGSAYAFSRNGTVWTQQQIIRPSDGTTGDVFGRSIAINGDTAIISAPHKRSAYVFTRGSSEWVAQQKLIPEPGAVGSFGGSVSINGETAVVSGGTGTIGLAHVFVRSGSIWSLQQTLSSPDGAFGFASSVSISGETAAIGTTGISTGSAYVFVRNGGVWTFQQELMASDQASGDYFGRSVSLSGDSVFVGANYDDTLAALNAGSAYVFHRTSVPPPPTPPPTATPTSSPTPTPTPPSSRAVSALPAYAVRNGTVSVPLELYSQGDEVGMQFSINFDPSILSNPTVALGSGVPPGTFLLVNPYQVLSGRLGMLIDSTAAFAASPPGRQLVTVTFSVSPNAPLGSTPITFGTAPTLIGFSDRFGNLLTAAFLPGSVTIRPGFEADVAGGDGEVLANDVALMRQFSVGNLTPPTVEQCKRIDVAPVATFGDGQISANDVIAARLYAVGNLQLALVDGPPCGNGMNSMVHQFDAESLFNIKERTNELGDNSFPMRGTIVRIADAKTHSGETVTIPIEIDAQGGETAVSFTLEYAGRILMNPRIALGDDAPHDATLTTNLMHSGKIGILIDSPSEFEDAGKASAKARRIVLVTFDVAKGSVVGEVPLKLTNTLARKSVSDGGGNALPAHFVNGKINIGQKK